MSYEYRVVPSVPYNSLLDGRLSGYGVVSCDLGNGRGELRINDVTIGVISEDGGMTISFDTHHGKLPDELHRALDEVFNVKIYSEGEPLFWGNETFEEVYGGEKVQLYSIDLNAMSALRIVANCIIRDMPDEIRVRLTHDERQAVRRFVGVLQAAEQRILRGE